MSKIFAAIFELSDSDDASELFSAISKLPSKNSVTITPMLKTAATGLSLRSDKLDMLRQLTEYVSIEDSRRVLPTRIFIAMAAMMSMPDPVALVEYAELSKSFKPRQPGEPVYSSKIPIDLIGSSVRENPGKSFDAICILDILELHEHAQTDQKIAERFFWPGVKLLELQPLCRQAYMLYTRIIIDPEPGDTVPHDSKNQPLAEGDEVTFKARVKSVSQGEKDCNVTLDVMDLIPDTATDYKPTIACNSKLVEKAIPFRVIQGPTVTVLPAKTWTTAPADKSNVPTESEIV